MKVRFPPPPLSNSLSDYELTQRPNGLAATGQRRPVAACHEMAIPDSGESGMVVRKLASDAARMADAWGHLPRHIQEAIGALVAVSQPPRSDGLTDDCSDAVSDTAWKAALRCRSIIQSCLREEEWLDADEEFFAAIRKTCGT